MSRTWFHSPAGTDGAWIGRVQGEVRAGRGFRQLSVGVAGVIEDLHLGSGLPRILQLLVDPEHDAAVACRLDSPFQFELEIAIGGACNDVAALPDAGDRAVHDPPAFRQRVRAIAPPGIGRRAIEKDLPLAVTGRGGLVAAGSGCIALRCATGGDDAQSGQRYSEASNHAVSIGRGHVVSS
jgi:hypothetical protein